MTKNYYNDRNSAADRDRHYEEIDPTTLTEQAGYIPPQVQIENMILAGQRLDASRRALYDFDSEDDIDEDASDPTRSGNFDLADATQLEFATRASLSKAKAEADAKKKAEQIAQEPGKPGEPEPVRGA